jgi:hypothetical protein
VSLEGHCLDSIVDWTHKGDFILYSRVVGFRPFKQALKRLKLKFKATADFIPAFESSVTASEVVVCVKCLVMVLHGVERSYGHAKGFADMHAVSRNLVQKKVVGLL